MNNKTMPCRPMQSRLALNYAESMILGPPFRALPAFAFQNVEFNSQHGIYSETVLPLPQ
jgi:hypothetical protein